MQLRVQVCHRRFVFNVVFVFGNPKFFDCHDMQLLSLGVIVLFLEGKINTQQIFFHGHSNYFFVYLDISNLDQWMTSWNHQNLLESKDPYNRLQLHP